ncbi:acyltransferase family protein [Bradyrhizobium guangdongense]|nr:acyltransferase family protein [Bradyrhizobium guangdongense]
MVLATIVAGGHLIWLHSDALTSGIASLGGKAAVAGFLVVSGFSIAASLDRDESGFYFRRFKRIYPMYFCSAIFAIALEIWLGTYQLPLYTIEAQGPLTAIGNLLMLQTFFVRSLAYNSVLWSLAVECAFYIISPCLKRLPAAGWAALTLISATVFVLPHSVDGGFLYAVALKANVIKYFWPFAMGFLLYQYQSTAVALVLGAIGATLIWCSDFNPERFAVATFACSFAVVALSRTILFKQSKAMDYLGDLSYSLYLLQLPTFILIYRMCGITNPVALLVGVFLTTIIAYELIDVRLKRAIFKNSVSFGELIGWPRLRINRRLS